jgi:hypothetical protein
MESHSAKKLYSSICSNEYLYKYWITGEISNGVIIKHKKITTLNKKN